MDSGPAPSPAPDYAGAAKATAEGNAANLQAQTVANRPNQVTPWGSSTWSTTPQYNQAGYDRAMADWTAAGGDPANRPSQNSYYNDVWTQKLDLSPQEQQALTDQFNIKSNQSDLAAQLQQQVASTMKNGMNTPSLADYLRNVGSVNQQFGGFTPYGVGGTDQRQINVGRFTNGVQGVDQNLDPSSPNVDLNTPQFSDATAQDGARSAYGAATGLLKDQWAQDTQALDNKLRLQGLQPGSEAYNNAVQNLSRTQAQQQNQIADQSVITGNQLANTNYLSALQGYNARNSAIGQQYGQDTNTFTTQNAARSQSLQNALAQYGASLQGQNAYNTAQGQAFGQSLAGYGANQTALQNSNQAQGQAFQQGLQGYGAAYQSALQNYLQPLNSMNAVLTGQQVSQPNMPSFATAGYTGGADMSGALQGTASWNQGLMNAQSASAASNNSALTGLAGAAMMTMF